MSSRTSQMVESVNAAARVGALCVSVLLFAAMWESDSPSEPQTHWLARRAGVTQSHSDEMRVPTSHTSMRRTAADFNRLLSTPTVTPEFSTVSLEGRSTPDFVLPVGIAPGCYRVVDSTGTVSSITVSESTVDLQRDVRPRGLYTSHTGNQTRYFIRVEPLTQGVAAAAPRTSR
ncbi:hypothetical protein GC176_27950 [bacterium]|nr:hypothetical protein [bacterium]